MEQSCGTRFDPLVVRRWHRRTLDRVFVTCRRHILLLSDLPAALLAVVPIERVAILPGHQPTQNKALILEARVGFEPTNGGFADLSLMPLGDRGATTK